MWPVVAALLLLAFQNPDYSAEGLKALDAQKYDLAAQYFTKAIEADPKDYAAYFNLALAETMLGKKDQAIAGYKKVLELKPGLYQAQLNLGMVLLGEKQPQQAVPYLQAAAEQKPDEFRPRMYLADALFEIGDFAKAAPAYERAAALDPKSAPAEVGIARCALRQNQPKEAEAHFRKAAALDPKLKSEMLELGPMYEKNGQKAEAIAIYQEFPDNPGARERLGQLLVETGRAADAIPNLEWAVKNSPTPANRLALALAYKRAGQLDKVLPVLEEAVQAAPGDLDLAMAYGRELRDQKQYAAAARQFYKVTQARPNSIEAWNELTGMLISLEQYPQAIDALDRIRALGGETAGHLYLRAIVLDKVRDQKGALESYRKFLASDEGKHPDEEFKARQRVRILERELNKR
jgi:tetratricopeptide (TPR) repeat protein